MAKGLKSNGMKELTSFKQRVIRQHNLGRIYTRDKDRLVRLINEAESVVTNMYEEGEQEW